MSRARPSWHYYWHAAMRNFVQPKCRHCGRDLILGEYSGWYHAINGLSTCPSKFS